jgi:hypothetical protein
MEKLVRFLDGLSLPIFIDLPHLGLSLSPLTTLHFLCAFHVVVYRFRNFDTNDFRLVERKFIVLTNLK